MEQDLEVIPYKYDPNEKPRGWRSLPCEMCIRQVPRKDTKAGEEMLFVRFTPVAFNLCLSHAAVLGGKITYAVRKKR